VNFNPNRTCFYRLGWIDPFGLCKDVIKLYHGTNHTQALFDLGIDPNKGGGQLGPGLYTTESIEAAIETGFSHNAGGALRLDR